MAARAAVCPAHAAVDDVPVTAGVGSEPRGLWRRAEGRMGFPGRPAVRRTGRGAEGGVNVSYGPTRLHRERNMGRLDNMAANA